MQDHSLIESFQDVKQEGQSPIEYIPTHAQTQAQTQVTSDLLRRCFWIWNSKMHNVVDIRNKAEEKGRSDRAMLLTAAFDKWRSKARKQKLDRLVRKTLTIRLLMRLELILFMFRNWRLDEPKIKFSSARAY